MQDVADALQMKLVRLPFADCAKGSCFKSKPNTSPGTPGAPTSVRRSRSCRRVEHYWLCDACSPYVTLTFDQERGVVTVPLPDGAGKKTVRVVTLELPNETAKVGERSVCEVRK